MITARAGRMDKRISINRLEGSRSILLRRLSYDVGQMMEELI